MAITQNEPSANHVFTFTLADNVVSLPYLFWWPSRGFLLSNAYNCLALFPSSQHYHPHWTYMELTQKPQTPKGSFHPPSTTFSPLAGDLQTWSVIIVLRWHLVVSGEITLGTLSLNSSSVLFFQFIYLWQEGREGEGEEEKHLCARNTSHWLVASRLSHGPNWGPGPQPRHVPWLGIVPVTLQFTGQCCPLSHTNQGCLWSVLFIFFKLLQYKHCGYKIFKGHHMGLEFIATFLSINLWP